MMSIKSGQTETCECCGAGQAVLTTQRSHFAYGVGENSVMLEADFPIWSCSICEESYTAEGAEEAERAAICRHLGRLTPEEILQKRKDAGLSQAAFAAVLGVGRVTLARWETGQQMQSAVYDRLIRQNAERTTLSQSPNDRFRTNVEHRRHAAQFFDLVA